jgi:hypothetical protein
MIQIGDIQIDFSDPLILGLGLVTALLLVLIFAVMRGAGRRDGAADQMQALGAAVQGLAQGQQQLGRWPAIGVRHPG